jgi:hypothetical protein
MGEQAVEQLYDGWSDEVMSADIDFFDPLDLLKAAVEKVTEGHTTALTLRLTNRQVAASVQRVFASSASSAPSFGNVHARHPPPPPGLDIPAQASGKRHGYFRNLKKTGRFPKNRDACVLCQCGKGEEPSSQGHRSDMCNAAATDAEIDNWVEHGIWAK